MVKRHITRNRCLATAVAAVALTGIASDSSAAIRFDLSTSNTDPTIGKTATVAVATPLTLNVWATVTGGNGSSLDDGLQSANLGFSSSGGPIVGNMANTAPAQSAPWNANGSQGGTQYGTAGDLDLGGTDATIATGWWIARAGQVQSNATGRFLLGQVTFTPSSLGAGTATNLQLSLRNNTAGALWFEDATINTVPNPDVWSNDKNPSSPGVSITYGGAVVVTGTAPGIPNRWGTNAGGAWGTGASWDDGNVPASGAAVTFGTAPGITAPATVTVDGGGRTVSGMTFDNSNKYTLGGTDTLTINGAATVTVTTGSHDITAPIALGANTAVSVAGSNILTVRNVTGAAQNLSKSGSGTLAVSPVAGSGLTVAAVSVSAGTLKTTGANASKMTSVAVTTGAGAKLDVNNGGLIVTADTVANVRSLLLAGSGGAGFAAQTWDQPGIMSTNAIADPLTHAVGYMDNDNFILGGKATFDGVSVPAGSILVKSTLAGDADLTGAVDDDDVTVLGLFYGGAGNWYEGDFDYTGVVDDDDVTILGLTYGTSLGALPGGLSAVPEPASFGILSVLAGGLALRRRHNR